MSPVDPLPVIPPERPVTPSVSQPFLHATPAEAVGELTYRSVTIEIPASTSQPAGVKTFQIAYPGNADRLLDHPSTHAAFQADEYMPYWAELWPAAQMLATTVLQTAGEQAPVTLASPVLEIGCGVGLPGIAALSLGLHVIFSDYDVTAVEFAACNARANGLTNFSTLPLDWRVPPDFQVPVILAADVIYEARNIEPLIHLIQKILAPDGVCLLSDPDRSTRRDLQAALQQVRLPFTRQTVTVPGTGDRLVQGSVYAIRQPVE